MTIENAHILTIHLKPFFPLSYLIFIHFFLINVKLVEGSVKIGRRKYKLFIDKNYFHHFKK